MTTMNTKLEQNAREVFKTVKELRQVLAMVNVAFLSFITPSFVNENGKGMVMGSLQNACI